MDMNRDIMLFNLSVLSKGHTEVLKTELTAIVCFEIDQNDIRDIMENRDQQLVDKGLIDFSTDTLVKAT